ncbi:cobalt-precorrin-6A reductase [Paraburkholderia sp. 22099]|jgi:precorrin-6A/cobalt-precorrin-6A reductase|uniref:Precorrin-6A reductase n=1 Tax=Paraburkholderia terricola TaxID=169427 RepID=A0A1M6RA50_9BURK|nr:MULTISPECIES: cobalt-precorrin-6A reductase [Paraburkholderia]ORC45427.1 cobalt-precorrin-6A reductase [Burkholderia sp. A27]MDR6409289.1 precorrin-6A/cobalt-precorrin-6A reductase [Paraburkholderia terricola]MDR6449017.1 precorrin-6A/cobalt-precorrin-6A reductase [Paraburkholderia terricola]MDR6482448.1 precorrin-6A/cobalt-precorrin-6A reductase [Paraburkholderia terricola]MDR6495128.1 precorrin-6A/cobalt-precorrin-6A reductase [Paraburkholderia terricola]
MTRVLLLGGTGDALRIARQLGREHVYSLAGLGKVPDDLACTVRVGGFGGSEGMARYIEAQRIALVIDATHPYAAQISANAVTASRAARVPCWALRREGWQPQAGDDWRRVGDWAELTAALAAFERPLFTLGREPLAHLDDIPAHQFWTVRCLDPHEGNARARILATRGPFTLEGERALFAAEAFDVVVSKNSGGGATEAKLEAARERGVPVVMLRRPPLPAVDREFERVADLLEALRIAV